MTHLPEIRIADQLWQPEFIGTLVFVVRDGQVLLIRKKTGHGAGLINGPGGKLQPGESVRECALRETWEEVGVRPHDLECRAELRFVELAGSQWLGFAFVAYGCEGEPKESAEAKPFWCDLDAIPYDQMWPDDRIWLPGVIDPQGELQVVNFVLEGDRLVDHDFVAEQSIWQDLRI